MAWRRRRRVPSGLCERRRPALEEGGIHVDHLLVVLEVELVNGGIVQAKHTQCVIFGRRELLTYWVLKYLAEEARLAFLFAPANDGHQRGNANQHAQKTDKPARGTSPKNDCGLLHEN